MAIDSVGARLLSVVSNMAIENADYDVVPGKAGLSVNVPHYKWENAQIIFRLVHAQHNVLASS